MVRVLLNLSSLPARPAGAGRYALELVHALREHTEAALLPVAPPWARRWGIEPAVLAPATGPLVRAAWEAVRLPWEVRSLEYDVYHGTHFTVPPGLGRPTVATAHDVTFLLYPRRYPASRRAYYRLLARSAVRARRLIVPSESVRREVVRRLGVEERRVRVVPEAPGSPFRPASEEAVRAACARFGIRRPYFLTFGAADPGKRAVDAIRALALLAEGGTRADLAVVGPTGRFTRALRREAERLGVGELVRFCGYVEDETLRALYTGAVALLFPSLWEGFGLPPLESLACGTPAVVADAPAMNEVLRPAAVFVPLGDPRALAEAAGRLLRPSEREEAVARGQELLARYTWERTASLTYEVYVEARRG